jgi:nucleotide-binding universal stress UspA family protein
MIPKIKRILYATDLSRNSAYAFRYAINSANHHGADIHILHVLDVRVFPVPRPGGEGAGTLIEGPRYLERFAKFQVEQVAATREKIRNRLGAICRKELQGNEALLRRVVSIEVTEGDPAAMILQKADELEADLVVMGSHGKGILAHTFLGSVAQKVLQRISIPALTIPIPKKTDIAFDDWDRQVS